LKKVKEFGAEAEKKARAQDEQRKQTVWPAAFQDGSPLQSWRQTITADAESQEPIARKLRDEIIGFEALTAQPSPNPERAAEALYQLSLDAHSLWHGKTDHDFVNTAIQWRDAFNELVLKRKLPLKIRAAFPKEPFDIDCMVVPQGSSDSRLYVKDPLSWIILSDSNKVLHRGLMLTV
jgi:hypothetical protein